MENLNLNDILIDELGICSIDNVVLKGNVESINSGDCDILVACGGCPNIVVA